jgi:hypothetical protein
MTDPTSALPPYKNQRALPPDTTLRHYTTLAAVESMVHTAQLRLRRIDRFEDPYEGSVPLKQVQDLVPLCIAANAGAAMTDAVSHHYPGMATMPHRHYDPFIATTIRRRAKTRSAHASCWQIGDESEAMWRLYCNDGPPIGQGIALQTTVGGLQRSLSHVPILLMPIQYRLYHEGPAFDDELDPFFHKRKGFEYEKEFRALIYDDAHYKALTLPLIDSTASDPPPLEEHIHVPWSPLSATGVITISPAATEDYEEKVRQTLAKSAPTLRVELSVLHERRYGAQF